MVNLRLGWSLISLIAATSMLLVRRKSSSSAFLSKTELAYHASIRKLRVMGKEKDSQQPYLLPPRVWLLSLSSLGVLVPMSAAECTICGS